MKIDRNKPTAVVLGLGQNGLATIRALGRQGIPVIGIDRDYRHYTARTRYCKKIISPHYDEGEHLIDILVELGKQLPQKGLLFPSGDFPLHLMSEKRESLQDYFHFTFPGRDVVRLTLDKKRFYKFAQERNILIPQTFFPAGTEDCRHAAGEIRYPCIIKPFQPNLGWRRLFPGQKLFVAENPESLVRLYEKLVVVHDDLIIQELIPGDDSQLSFSLTYFDKSSRPLGMFTGHKVRQYPPAFGTSSLAESRWDPFIAEKTIKILQEMQYTGYGSVEFKWDPRSKEFKALEVTARTWFPHGISTACNLNLVFAAYCDQVGLPVPKMNGFPDGVKWVHEERDLRSCLIRLRNRELTPVEWLGSYRGRRTYAIAAWDDPAPALYLVGNLLSAPFRRISRLLPW
ncbi:MAG: hypothetical protein LLG06_19100 [Desulfobacteraceae bacterium]|nr:hypothetical protein [Desulfobacteraceae bacterium]